MRPISTRRAVDEGCDKPERTGAARTSREPCRRDGLPLEPDEIDDGGGFAGNIGQHARPLLDIDERLRVPKHACARRQIEGCVLQLRRDPLHDHPLCLDAIHDPLAQLARVAVGPSARDSDADVLDALRAKARGEMLAKPLGVCADPVGLVQHDELPRQTRCPPS